MVLICPTAQEEMCTTGSLRMAGMRSHDSLHVIASGTRSNPDFLREDSLDCFVALLLAIELAQQ